ncbi:hypothetical protein D3C76_933940 [compost metagenome]
MPANEVVIGVLETGALFSAAAVGTVDIRRDQVEIAHFFELLQMFIKRNLHRGIFQAGLSEVVFQLLERLGFFQAQCRVDIVFRIIHQHLVTGPITDIAITLMPGLQFFL